MCSSDLFQGNFFSSIQSVFQYLPFRYFVFSYLVYWLALTFIQSGIIYYVTLLFGIDKSYATLFGVATFILSLCFYPVLGQLNKRFSKKKVLLGSFMLFGLTCVVLLLPLSGMVRFGLVTVLTAFPFAAFGILPNTFVADAVHENEKRTGQYQAGMFYAVAAFMMKVGISLANLIFPSLLVYGKSVENPTGVRLTVVAALVFCTLGFFIFRKYEE